MAPTTSTTTETSLEGGRSNGFVALKTAASDKNVPTGASTVKEEIDISLEQQWEGLRALNRKIYENPELAWEEHIAHDSICDFLEELGFEVVRHAYGLSTAFEARFGSGGRLVNFNAEYDALPGIGHACGHNLIAISSIAGFLSLASALKKLEVDGRLQLLGTPAEENGGGKINLVNAGAYKGVDASLMGHPNKNTSSAGMRSLAQANIICEFHGRSAHAGGQPWEGINALDAVVASYNNISMLRQQLHPTERVHGCILESPKAHNVIPDRTKIMFTARSTSREKLQVLIEKLKSCFKAGAMATGCDIKMEQRLGYADLRVNNTLCQRYESHMAAYEPDMKMEAIELMTCSTDQGNVSYEVPALHAMIGIPCPADGKAHHTTDFTKAAGTEEAFDCAMTAGKVLALTGWDVLMDAGVNEHAKADFNSM